jgi:hypothetical protein
VCQNNECFGSNSQFGRGIGVIIGTVEIVNCTGRPGDYEWHLANPERLDEAIKLEKRPQPVWFIPF